LATGVSEGYVSQLLSDETVAAAVTERRAVTAAKFIEHDERLDSDEEVARKLVRRNLDNGILRPMEALRHFQVLNAARRQSQGAQTQVPLSTIVALQLPPSARVEFKLTVDKQVVEVDGRSMATMPASHVQKLLRNKKAQEDLTDVLELPANGKKMTITTPSLLDSI
jgi:non-ribosomal peptide synthetase component F